MKTNLPGFSAEVCLTPSFARVHEHICFAAREWAVSEVILAQDGAVPPGGLDPGDWFWAWYRWFVERGLVTEPPWPPLPPEPPPLAPPPAAGGGAATAGAVALAIASVAWLITKLVYTLWFETPPLPPTAPPPPPTPPGPYVPTVICEKFLTTTPLDVTGYGVAGFFESGCAIADRSAYAKAAAVCNKMYCGGNCRVGGPCVPDYVPVTLTRDNPLAPGGVPVLGLSSYLVCSSTLTFHCRCKC